MNTREVDKNAYRDAWAHVGGIEARKFNLWPPIPDTDSGWMLFVDKAILNDVLPRMHNISETLHQPVKYEGNPVMIPEQPWEGLECPPDSWPHDFGFYGDTMYDEEEQIFKMWYTGVAEGIQNNWNMCYATSEDGMHWEKPNLGLFEYKGSKDNNICFESLNEEVRQRGVAEDRVLITHHFNGVVKDMADPDPARRYKSVSLQSGMYDVKMQRQVPDPPTGIYPCTSPDGIHWTTNPDPVFVDDQFEYGICDVVTLSYNRKRNKYVVLMKGHVYDPGTMGDQGGLRRLQQVVESDDFEEWTTPSVAIAADDQDPVDLHIYGMSAFDYENMYLGLIVVFRANDDDRTTEIQLVSSRNGRHWRRAGNRETFIPIGERWGPDSGEIFTCRQPVEVGDEVWFYYSAVGGPRPHVPFIAGDPPQNSGTICLAKLPRGRFVSMDAGEEEGWLLTMPMKLKGNTLHLNANAANGDILVEIREVVYHEVQKNEYQWNKQLGAPIPGFSRHDCNVIITDSLDRVVTWRGNADLSGIGDREVMLRFIMRNAELYGFKID